MSKKVIIIGAGFGGLSAACYLAKSGYRVEVYEKNHTYGGRAWVNKVDGFTFDMGPSWYMMPDVFEEFFADFGKKTTDYYELKKLNPSYQVLTDTNRYDVSTVPSVYTLFEQLEPGSSRQLQKLLKKTEDEYKKVRASILQRPMLGPADVLKKDAVAFLMKPSLIGSYHSRIATYIKHPDLQKILEFMVVFMGGSPKNIPALYTLLAYVDMGLGIWYPMGGMGKLADAMYDLARSLGVKFIFNSDVSGITRNQNRADGIMIGSKKVSADIVVANADYQFVDSVLLGRRTKWDKMTLSPSGVMAYIGVRGKLSGLRHHNLFLDSDWDRHFDETFNKHTWSNEPMFYVSVPSITDPTVAPNGMENMFILAPMANGLHPTPKQNKELIDDLIDRIEKKTNQNIKDKIVYIDIKSHDYFENMFHAYKGNAFGLAHTLGQSAILRPPLKDKSIDGLYYAGQYTNPGTGVPIVTLSGKVVTDTINSFE